MKINKFGLILAGSLAVAGINETQAQVKNSTTQDLSENFSKNKYIIVNDDLPEKIESHEDFITTRIDKIFKLYGKEKALELINEHMLIEINKFREENGKPPLKLDPQIQELSQERAEHLYNGNSCEHGKGNDSLGARIQQKKIEFVVGGGENICQGFKEINAANNAFKASEEHRNLMLKDECNFCGTGVKCTNCNNNATGNTAFIGGGKYHQSNEPFRVHWCITIVQKEKMVQEKETAKKRNN